MPSLWLLFYPKKVKISFRLSLGKQRSKKDLIVHYLQLARENNVRGCLEKKMETVFLSIVCVASLPLVTCTVCVLCTSCHCVSCNSLPQIDVEVTMVGSN